MTHRLLLFGATGAIGTAVLEHALARDWSVVAVTRGAPLAHREGVAWQRWNPVDEEIPKELAEGAPFDAVCWAQGANATDSVGAFDAKLHLSLYEANVLAVLQSMAALVAADRLRSAGARLVVVSSIWQERARADKLSYTVTKAAIGGLVRSAAVDLGRAGHLVNAVLPGVLDTPMTRANLSDAQLAGVAGRTTLSRLPDLATLAETILFLCSDANNAVTGQSIAVDLGMSNACIL